MSWVEAVIDGSAGMPGKPLSLELPGGVRLEIADARQAIVAGSPPNSAALLPSIALLVAPLFLALRRVKNLEF